MVLDSEALSKPSPWTLSDSQRFLLQHYGNRNE